MSAAPVAYPLSWPRGWPRTEAARREPGKQFSQVTLEGALAGLRKEVERLGGTGLVLSSNYTLGVGNPADPGVVAYFTYEKAQVAIPCDRWSRVAANVRAIALTIEAMRGMERWGAKHMIKAMFSGFQALPGPAAPRSFWELASLSPSASWEEAGAAYRQLAKINHPDMGGSNTSMAAVNEAWTSAKAERGWT